VVVNEAGAIVAAILAAASVADGPAEGVPSLIEKM
jgi:hypothetical protein